MRAAHIYSRITIGLFTIGLLITAELAFAATRVFYDGSEAGNTNLWSQDGSHARCTSVTSGADGTTAYAGSRFISCNSSGTPTETYDSLTIPTSNYTNELFIRTRIRLDADHDKTGGSSKKLLRIFYWDGDFATYKDSFSVEYGDSLGYQCNSGNGAACSAYWGQSGDNTAQPGSWHMVEHYFNSSTGQVKVWNDDVLVKDQIVGITANKWTPFYITSNWSDAHDAINHVYFDEFEVYSDNGSGGTGSMSAGTITQGGADTTPPAAPTGLGVQ